MRNRIFCATLAASLAGGLLVLGSTLGLQLLRAAPANPVKTFRWRDGKRAAVSLSFDDARVSQIDTGLALLNRQQVKATLRTRLPSASYRMCVR